MRTSYLFLLGLAMLAGCGDPTMKPDYTIRVIPTNNGMVAVPPDCPSWATENASPFDNQPIPQFGCANARNLALMVDQPSDLIKGRDPGTASGVTTVGAIRRYNNNQTRGLIDPDSAADTSIAITTAPTASSPMTGEATGGGSSSSSSSAAASSAAP